MIDYEVIIPKEIECLPSTAYVECMEYGVRKTSFGFEIPAEKMDHLGEFIRPRWAKVYWKADDINTFDIGDWVLISYGRWSTSLKLNIDGESKELWFLPKNTIENYIIAKSKEIPEHLKQYQ